MRCRRQLDGGQATVELALALPFVALTLLLVVQVLLVAVGRLRVEHAAREGARVAAVDPDPDVARQAATAGLDPARTRVLVSWPSGDVVTVTVSHRLPTEVPLVGGLVPDLEVSAAASFRAERAPDAP